MSNTVSQFLRRDINKAFAQVTGDYVNTGTGYGLDFLYLQVLWARILHQETSRVAFYS